MDVYHKVLTKIYETTNGGEAVDVDLVDLLKKEGFYPSIDDIKAYMSSESWIAETSRINVIRITHWGVAEAKRALSNQPDKGRIIEKETARFINLSKDLHVMAEELAASPSDDKLDPIQSKISEIESVVGRIKNAI